MQTVYYSNQCRHGYLSLSHRGHLNFMLFSRGAFSFNCQKTKSGNKLKRHSAIVLLLLNGTLSCLLASKFFFGWCHKIYVYFSLPIKKERRKGPKNPALMGIQRVQQMSVKSSKYCKHKNAS